MESGDRTSVGTSLHCPAAANNPAWIRCPPSTLARRAPKVIDQFDVEYAKTNWSITWRAVDRGFGIHILDTWLLRPFLPPPRAVP
jgi:hypothetical protein